jgi:hypothetical protein
MRRAEGEHARGVYVRLEDLQRELGVRPRWGSSARAAGDTYEGCSTFLMPAQPRSATVSTAWPRSYEARSIGSVRQEGRVSAKSD